MSIEQWTEPPAAAVDPFPPGPTSRLVEWAREADAALELARRLTMTTFCPESFRGKPADAAAAMLAGGELGLSPLAALGAFDIIQGRAAARAVTLRALVQSKGHEMVLVESTNTRCKMKGRRAGSSEWQTVAWTVERARDLGLLGKRNWREQPQAMLQARATSELARLIAADAILGIGGGVTSEELSDGPGPPPAPEISAPEDPAAGWGTRRMSRPKPDPDPAPVEEPAPQVASEPPATPEPDPDPITPAQLKKLHTTLSKAGITDRDEGLALYETILGHPVASSKDLSKDEASRVIDRLESVEVQDPPSDEWPA